MKTVSVYEAKTHLSRLLAEVEAGERVAITRHGVTVAELVRPLVRGARGSEPLHHLVLRVAPDAFDPLTTDELTAFEGPLVGR